MQSIPREIYEEIFQNITNIADLLNLRAVNKSFEAEFTPVAFRKVSFYNNCKGVTRFQKLISASRLCRHVHELSFVVDDSDVQEGETISGDSVIGEDKLKGPEVIAIFTMLAPFVNVKTISLHFPARENRINRPHYPLYRLHVEATLITALVRNANSIFPTALILKNLCFKPRESYNLPGLYRFMGRLAYLSIDLPRPNVASEISEDEKKELAINLASSWLEPVQSNLSTLVLGPTNAYIGPESFYIPHIPFRILRKLSLNHIIFAFSQTSLIDMGAFIVSEPVAETLEVLQLNKCALKLELEHGGMWADIFITFRQRLMRLRQLEIEKNLVYMRLVPDVGYQVHDVAPETSQYDREELNALWKSIGQRKRAK